MNAAGNSLHRVVEKWLAPFPPERIHVVHFGRTRGDGRRYVHVEVPAPGGPRGIFFFRHDDGCWCVFPSRIARPSMIAYRLAA